MRSIDWTAVGAMVQASATVILVVVTWIYVGKTAKIVTASEEQAEAANTQAEATSEMTSSSVRPLLVVTSRRIGWNTNRHTAHVEFVIANVGTGPALNPTVQVMKRTDDGGYQRVRGWKRTFSPIAAGAGLPDGRSGMESVVFDPPEVDRQSWQQFATNHDESQPKYGLNVVCNDMYGDRWLIQYRPKTEREWRMSRLEPSEPIPTDAVIEVPTAVSTVRVLGNDVEDSDS